MRQVSLIVTWGTGQGANAALETHDHRFFYPPCSFSALEALEELPAHNCSASCHLVAAAGTLRLRSQAGLLAADARIPLGAPPGFPSGRGRSARRQADGSIRHLPGRKLLQILAIVLQIYIKTRQL